MGIVASSFLSVGTALSGAVLRGITSYLEKEPFIYYQGKLPQRALKDDFSLLSWNICCIGGAILLVMEV